MKKHAIVFVALVVVGFALAFGARVDAQTLSLSGAQVSLTVVPAGTASALEDTLTAVHGALRVAQKAANDSITATHTNLRARVKLAADSLTAAHTGITARTKTLSDSVTAAHTGLTARTKTLSDSVTAGHTALTARTKTLGDSVTAAHSSLTARAKTLADSLTALHVRLRLSLGVTGVLHEQADVAVNATAIADSEQTILNLRTASTRYVLRNLRLKSADPGANTVTVYLYEFINDAFINVDTFAITTANYTSYFSLQDMFGEPQVYGDNLMVMIKSSAGGPYAVTGQYSYAKTNN